MVEKRKTRQIDIEWENRVLCSDGNCIGVVGPDGRCKECGLTGPRGAVAVPEAPEPEEDLATEAEGAASPKVVSKSSARSSRHKSSRDLEWENRTLCIDGNCIGVIAPDGRCKECGKTYVEGAGEE